MPLALGRFMSSLAQVRLGPSKPILKPPIQKRMIEFGWSVECRWRHSGSGGSYYEDSDATGVNPSRADNGDASNSGAVYVY